MNTDNKGMSSVYLSILSLIRLKPFGDSYDIYFINDKDGSVKPSQWNVIIGNNNTGKTRLLNAIANTLVLRKESTNNFESAYKQWIHNQLALRFKNLGINPTDIREKNFENEFKRIQKIVDSEFEKSPTVLGTTIYKDYISDNINTGDYKSGNFDSSKLDEDNFIINVGEAKYTCALPQDSYPFVVGYGVNRRSAESNLSTFQNDDSVASLLTNDNSLLNVEDWLIQTDYALKNNIEGSSETMNKIKQVLTSGILPDVNDFRFSFIRTHTGIQSYVEFSTPYGWNSLNRLGYGYQASITWLLDLSKRMIDRYPDAEDPLKMPAIVLIDEIDLHLHPAWQRKMIGHLSNIFPNVQFIVTAHSPLIIQSAKEINLIMLKKEKDYIRITQPDVSTYKGWSVEEIMSEVMELEDSTYSDTYLELMANFDEALDQSDHKKAATAYEKLDEILPPESGQRKILRIQMATLSESN